jgi:hypothetical protein
MLTIENIHKIITQSFVVSKNGTNEHWVVNDIDLLTGVYDINVLRKLGIFDTIKRTIRIQREKNELDMYSVQIIQEGFIIDKDQIRLRNIQTAEGMLGELKTIMKFV